MRYLFIYITALIMMAIFIYPKTVIADEIYRISQDKSKAVFFIYYHIGEDEYPNSNLHVNSFLEHVRELQEDEYNVLASLDIIEKLKANKPLKQHSIAITLEGAYKSSFKNAIPLLLEAKLPFTLFIAPERIDRKSDYYMSWKEIKKLAKNKLVTIGALPFSYQHIINLPAEEQMKLWGRSIARFKEELGFKPEIFAWPYGEYTNEMQEIMQKYDFKAGFAQHSGVAYNGSDFMALPRFSMTDKYGDLDRFKLAAQSLPMPVNTPTPKDMIISDGNLNISFKIPAELPQKERISCFMSDIGKLETNISGDGLITINIQKDKIAKRLRMNCTMPTLSHQEEKEEGLQYWRWYGRLFINKDSY